MLPSFPNASVAPARFQDAICERMTEIDGRRDEGASDGLSSLEVDFGRLNRGMKRLPTLKFE